MRIVTTLLLLFFFGTVPLAAQWRSLDGPPGGIIVSVAAEGDIALAATTHGVYRSIDAGRTWQSYGLNGRQAHALHIRNGISYAAVGRVAYVRRPDGEWTAHSLGIDGMRFVSNDRAVFAFAVTNSGAVFYRTIDSGERWTERRTLVPFVARSTAMTSSGDALIVAGASNTGAVILRSTDDGESWTPTGLDEERFLPTQLASAGSRIVGLAQGSLVLSEDQGKQWTVCTDCPGARQWDNSTVLGSDDSAFYIVKQEGVYRSGAALTGWDSLGRTIGPVTALARSGNRLIGGTSLEAIQASTDRGQSWIPSASGIAESYVRAMLHHAGKLFVATTSGLYTTGDYGREWRFAGLKGNLTALAAIGNALFVARVDSGVYRSTNDGIDWKNVSTGLLAPDTNLPLTVDALHVVNGRVLAGSLNGIHASTDGGESWRPTALEQWPAEPIRGFASVGARVYAVSGGSTSASPFGSVYLSDDGGMSFRRSDLAHNFPSRSVAAHLDTVIVAHYATERRLSISRDASRTWAPWGSPQTFPPVIFALAYEPGTYFAGTSAGVFRASTMGFRLVSFNQGLDTTLSIMSLLLDGAGLLAGSAGGGLWQRTDLVSGITEPGQMSAPHARLVSQSEQIAVDLAPEWIDPTVRLVDVLGRDVARGTVTGNTAIVDVAHAAHGAYFLLIDARGHTRTLPIMID